jgi:hypothetical protein
MVIQSEDITEELSANVLRPLKGRAGLNRLLGKEFANRLSVNARSVTIHLLTSSSSAIKNTTFT